MAAHLDQDMSILSKSLGTGGAGVYTPSQYEYAMSPAPALKGGKKGAKTRGRKVRRTKRRRTAKKGVLRKAKSALLKMFRM
jgi:hypothetical protein